MRSKDTWEIRSSWDRYRKPSALLAHLAHWSFLCSLGMPQTKSVLQHHVHWYRHVLAFLVCSAIYSGFRLGSHTCNTPPPPTHTLREREHGHQPTEDGRRADTGQDKWSGHNQTKVMVVIEARPLCEGQSGGRHTVLVMSELHKIPVPSTERGKRCFPCKHCSHAPGYTHTHTHTECTHAFCLGLLYH